MHLIIWSFHGWFACEGGRRGWIKIVLAPSVPGGALSLSSYFSPRAADCKDTFTKGRPLLCHLDYHACVARDSIFKCLFLSPWHLSAWCLSPPPPVRNKWLHFSAFGKWPALCDLVSPFVWLFPWTEWVFNKYCRNVMLFSVYPECNQSLKGKCCFFFSPPVQEWMFHSGYRLMPPQAKSNILTFPFITSASNLHECSSSPLNWVLLICCLLSRCCFSFPWLWFIFIFFK